MIGDTHAGQDELNWEIEEIAALHPGQGIGQSMRLAHLKI